MGIYLLLAGSLVLNGFLIWYVVKILRKFMFISENIADLFLTTKAFRVFVSNLYGMDNYHGEPMIQEMMIKLREVNNEIENFRDIFEYALDEEIDEELEEELNGPKEETQEIN